MQGPGIWNGVPVLVTLSDESTTGFLNVLKQPGGRKKPYYVKFKPDGEKRQRTLPGSSSSTAWEAACKYGYYLATIRPRRSCQRQRHAILADPAR